MSQSRLLWILYDQRVLLPTSTCRLVCAAWRDALDARKEILVVDRMNCGGVALSKFLTKLSGLKAVHFDRQYRKIHSGDEVVGDFGHEKRKGPATLREREDEKIQGAFRALSVCHPVEISLTFCRLTHQDLDAFLKVLADQVSHSFGIRAATWRAL